MATESFNIVNQNIETEVNIVQTKKVELKKTIGVIGGAGIVFGSVFGSGIFIVPTSILNSSGSYGVAMCIWVICGLISITGGLCFAELGTMIPKSGAEYNYLLESFGPMMAFSFIWTNVFIVKPSSVAIIAITCGKYVAKTFFAQYIVPEIIVKLIAASVIMFITLINMLSVKWSIRINNILNWSKFICFLIFLITGFVNLRKQEARDYFKKPFSGKKIYISDISNAFYNGLWAYDGFHNLNYAAEEMKNPEKNLPKSIILGMIFVTISYILLNFSYIAAIGPLGILQSDATIGEKFFKNFAIIVPILVSCSTFGSEISTIFGNGRLLFVAAREGHLPSIMSAIHNKLHTPIPSLFFTAIFSLLMLIPSTESLDALITLFSFATWSYFLLCFIIIIYLRFKKPNLHRPFKVWLILPIFMSLVSVVLLAITFSNVDLNLLIAIGIILCGIPVYFIFIYYKNYLPQIIFQFFQKTSKIIMKIYNLTEAKSEEDMG